MYLTTRPNQIMRGLTASLLLLNLVLIASPASAGDHFPKHRKLTYELVQGYVVQPASSAQTVYVPYPVPVPAEAGQALASAQGAPSLQAISKAASAPASLPQLPQPSAPLFSTLSFAPAAAAPQFNLVSLANFAAAPSQLASTPLFQAAPAQVQTVQVAAMPAPVVQIAAMPIQVAAAPVQIASLPLVQTTTSLAAVPAATPVVAQGAQSLTPVQFLLPKKHCFFGLGH